MDFLQQQGIQVKVVPGMLLNDVFIFIKLKLVKKRVWILMNVDWLQCFVVVYIVNT